MDMKQLEVIAITLCASLPLNLTLFEENGFCKNPSDYCPYCKKQEDDVKKFLCYKKTYTLDILFNSNKS